MQKRGQIAIFIIIGIVIVVAGILIYFFYPEISVVFRGEIIPNNYLAEKIEPDLEEGIVMLSEQGGYAEPQGYILYRNNKVKYLCYSSLYHEVGCRIQQPMIKAKYENELSAILQAKVEQYVAEMIADFERQGYEVSAPENIESKVSIVPDKIIIEITAPFSAVKDGQTQTFMSFKIEKNSKMYDLLFIALSIIDYESTYGDAASDLYTIYYPNIIVKKTPSTIDTDTTIWELEEATTKETFTFATRGLAWGAGYGLE